MNDEKNQNALRRFRLMQGFVLSVLLQCITALLYRIPYLHAAALDPAVFNVKLPAVDDLIPVVPIFFFGYIWSYVYWFFAPFFIIRTGRKKTWEFIVSYTVVLLICSLIMYGFPTKIDRVAEGLWEPYQSGFFWDLLHICYNVDGGSVSYDLLPSMHCANCVLYCLALRDEHIPKKIRTASLLSAILVIVSTLLTKQHYFLDAVTGVLIPLLVTPVIVRTVRLLRQAACKEAPDGK